MNKLLEFFKKRRYTQSSKPSDACPASLAFDRAMSLTGEIVDKAKLLQLELAQLEHIGIEKKCK